MPKISFYMAGSGNWGKWFPDKNAYALYDRLYPKGLSLTELSQPDQAQIAEWQKPRFVEIKNGVVIPLVPIFTDADNHELAHWFTSVTQQATTIIAGQIDDYRDLAEDLSDGGQIPRDYLLTILICAHTLDVGTLHRLQAGIMGEPPQRADSGSYFLWGETATRDLTNFFGVNSYGMLGFTFSLMWSPTIERHITNQKSITIPVFRSSAMENIRVSCGTTSERLATAFSESVPALEANIDRCSFKGCS